ncbi:hypothetical protein ACFRIB_53385 [Streptomyces mirabilis]|uniref:hypothetical protein n=1 Tax=Streptomyces mirabilis TaxID=68239 RepID=UPI00367B18EA
MITGVETLPCGVEELVGDPLDHRYRSLHASRVEEPGDHPLPAGVAVGAVVGQGGREPETDLGQHAQGGHGQRGNGMQGVVRSEGGRVEQHPAYVTVTADQPQAGREFLVHERLGTQHVQPGMRGAHEVVAEQIERVERRASAGRYGPCRRTVPAHGADRPPLPGSLLGSVPDQAPESREQIVDVPPGAG